MTENRFISDKSVNIINNFITDLKFKEDLSQKTLKEYSGDIKHFVTWYESSTTEYSEDQTVFNIENIATPTITKYRETMQKVIKLKPSTINRRLMTLKRFFDWSKDKGFINKNPSSAVKLVRTEKNSPRQMTEKEISDLVAATERALRYIIGVYVVMEQKTAIAVQIIFDTKYPIYRRSEFCTVKYKFGRPQ